MVLFTFAVKVTVFVRDILNFVMLCVNSAIGSVFNPFLNGKKKDNFHVKVEPLTV